MVEKNVHCFASGTGEYSKINENKWARGWLNMTFLNKVAAEVFVGYKSLSRKMIFKSISRLRRKNMLTSVNYHLCGHTLIIMKNNNVNHYTIITTNMKLWI